MKTRNILPTLGSRNITLYYLLIFFARSAVVLPNWVFFFGRFIAIPAIAMVDGISKIVAVVLEVPSGAVSDTFGKRRTLIAAGICLMACSVIILLANSFVWFLAGSIVMFIGYTLMSGSFEALLYDYVSETGRLHEYENVLGKAKSVEIATSIVTICAGGLLYRVNPSLTFWAYLVSHAVGVAILLFMKDPLSEQKRRPLNLDAYKTTLTTGFSAVFRRPIFVMTVPVLFFATLARSYEGVIRQNTGNYFAFNGETFAYLLAAISIPALVASYNFGRIYRRLRHNTEYLIGAFYLMGFLIIVLTNNKSLGVASFLAVYVAQRLAEPYRVNLVNQNTDSAHRATALSTVQLVAEIPYIVVTVFFGYLVEIDQISYLYSGLAACVSIYLAFRILTRAATRR